jgi:hypothetical protein
MSGHFYLGDMSYDPRKQLGRKLTEKFREFITNHPPSKFSRHLRCLFFDYLQEQSKKDLPLDFDIYVWELYDLFDLLDCAIDEWENSKEKHK